MIWKIILIILGIFSTISLGASAFLVIYFGGEYNAMLFVLLFLLALISTIYVFMDKKWAKVVACILTLISIFLAYAIKMFFTPTYGI